MSGANASIRRLYLYHPDANNFAALGTRSNGSIMRLYESTTPEAANYVPLAFHAFADNSRAEGDFPSLSNYCCLPFASKRAWDALRPLIGYCCESLPVLTPLREKHFILHVMDTIDCLDQTKSNVMRSAIDGRISRIYQYAFKWPLLEGKHIFKLPLESGDELIVDDAFRAVVEAHRLQGLVFRELPLAAN